MEAHIKPRDLWLFYLFFSFKQTGNQRRRTSLYTLKESVSHYPKAMNEDTETERRHEKSPFQIYMQS